jgi:undecaprenyl pyrophosphate phosphatase UppP
MIFHFFSPFQPCGALAPKMIDPYKTIQHHDIVILPLGISVAFVVAMFAIKTFIGFRKNSMVSNG